MTTIHNLPEEILITILKELDDEDDYAACQHVCRSWYNAAHLLLLKRIDLWNHTSIQEFIKSIDHNPKPTYLNAVKSIYIFDSTEEEAAFGNEMIRKLFCRFPNLGKVEIFASFDFYDSFTDEICDEFLTNCPKNDTFETSICSKDEGRYCEAMYKIRKLLTKLDVDQIKDVSKFGNPRQFITSFPRLRELEGWITSDTIEGFLSFFEQLPQLKEFQLNTTTDDNNAFAEDYFLDKSDEDKTQVLKRLADVESMSWNCVNSFFVNSIMLISKYFTGLKSFDFGCRLPLSWTDAKQRLFFTFALDLVQSIRRSRMEMIISIENLAGYFPIVVAKTFQRPSIPAANASNRTVRAIITEKSDPNLLPDLIVVNNQKLVQSGIVLNISKETSLRHIAAHLFKTTVPLNDVDEFILEIKSREKTSYYRQKVTVKMYSQILAAMPFLKEVTLDIPASFVAETENDSTIDTLSSRAEKLTLRPCQDRQLQPLLNQFSVLFPNLKHLKLLYFCGIWKEFIGEFQVELGKYTLESLTIDVTPLKAKQTSDQSKEGDVSDAERFFVVEVVLLTGSEHHLYKIPFCLSSATPINHSDLKGLSRNKDYLVIRILVESLQKLDLYIYTGTHKSQSYDYLHDSYVYDTKKLTVFDNK